MRVAKDLSADSVAGNSRSKIPAFSRALATPLLGALILDGSTVYYGSGTGWVPISGSSSPFLIEGNSFNLPAPLSISDPAVTYLDGSYYYTTVDNGVNQTHTLSLLISFQTDAGFLTQTDIQFDFPLGSLPSNVITGQGGFCYSQSFVPQTYGCNIIFGPGASFILSPQQIPAYTVPPSGPAINSYVTSISFTWVE
jgi:hypothetical protein